jgi:hypothetical protein
MIAVDGQKRDRWIWLMVLTRKACSSSGSEFAGWAFWAAGGSRKLTAGMLPSVSVL